MILDQDLDIQNFSKCIGDDEILVYLRSDEESVVHVIMGESLNIVNVLLEIEDLQDIILNAAAYIVKENNLDFNEILENVTTGEDIGNNFDPSSN